MWTRSGGEGGETRPLARPGSAPSTPRKLPGISRLSTAERPLTTVPQPMGASGNTDDTETIPQHLSDEEVFFEPYWTMMMPTYELSLASQFYIFLSDDAYTIYSALVLVYIFFYIWIIYLYSCFYVFCSVHMFFHALLIILDSACVQWSIFIAGNWRPIFDKQVLSNRLANNRPHGLLFARDRLQP